MVFSAALLAAVFGQQRTGKGQLVHSSLMHIAVWTLNQAITMAQRHNVMLDLLYVPKEGLTEEEQTADNRLMFPVATANCFTTQDGQWLQFLGVELPRHLGSMLGVLGLKWSVYPRALKIGLWDIALGSGPKLGRMPPLFSLLNGSMDAAMRQRNWADIKQAFDDNGIWYCKVRTVEQ